MAAVGVAIASTAAAQCPLIKINAPDAAAGDNFGAGLAMSGDHVVVGSPCDDDAGLSSGGAYVFARNQGGADNWGFVTKLTPDDPAAGDELGFPVSISGDFAIVGARLEGDAGAAYIFLRNQGGPDQWGQVVKLTPIDGEFEDLFGQTVSISGDFAIVGAPRHDGDAGSNSGAAYVFARDQGGPDLWGLVKRLVPADIDAGDRFGQSVALSGDMAIVGSFRDDDVTDDAGAAYVFARNEDGPNQWGQVAKLTDADSATGDEFGYSVDVDGDLALVAARRNDELGLDAGVAYIFARNHGEPDAWGQVKKLFADDGGDGDAFGGAISIRGDLAVVGASGHSVSVSNIGAAYLFSRNHGGADNWGQVARLTVASSQTGDRFSFPASISGDRIVLGAYGDDDQGEESGSIYVFDAEAVPSICADTDGDGIVGITDLLAVILSWGPCNSDEACTPDLDFDGNVGVGDLVIVITNWT